MLAAFSATLQTMTNGTASATGTNYRIQVQPGASPTDTWSFDYALTALQGTSPTLQVFIEGSSDGSNWYTVANTSALNATGNGVMDEPATDTPQFIRSRLVAGGTVTQADCKVRIRSTGPFTLSAA